MQTTSSLVCDFFRLRFAQTDYRCKLTFQASMQASDLITSAHKMAVPIDFPRW
jgi:hypothetical protein